ncbi:uncharacterized protein K460DRAFT_403297 [Cucurbitaria berberidis CBS 394.84]|uniref:Uncharacterized protein n=1 Tax=Cucurbitaria berberidis CBS 394.84 TaxID=1168544 RepID=A0A9P4LA42_9PLEO|nr:uncharacterized protein K460DRAFT_403297 [Cucurbitaria berberidis CBS 394.84]KAF1847986.1 hypothetical protein K460DRAFT_403297 [Cucurbitaria berberidis CBS 394.84]
MAVTIVAMANNSDFVHTQKHHDTASSQSPLDSSRDDPPSPPPQPPPSPAGWNRPISLDSLAPLEI